jgi:hypothetical protein
MCFLLGFSGRRQSVRLSSCAVSDRTTTGFIATNPLGISSKTHFETVIYDTSLTCGNGQGAVVAVGASLVVSVGIADGGDVGFSDLRLVIGVGTVVRCDRAGVRPGSAAAGGATDVAGTSLVGGGAGEVVPIVDSTGPAGCTGSGGPAR